VSVWRLDPVTGDEHARARGRRQGLERHLEEAWFERAAAELKARFEAIGVPVAVM
jgi:crotonobetainyl-CoA:carnitine CoA-transferase CaiB-like acyl-CoA transferase